MIPYGLTQDQFARRFRQMLDRRSLGAIQIIRTVLGESLHETVRRAAVQIFIDTEGCGAPSVWIYLVGENMKTSEQSREICLDFGDMHDIDERYFSDDDFGGIDLMADALKAWFAECWWKAGGWGFAVAAELSVHDGFGNGSRVWLTQAGSSIC